MHRYIRIQDARKRDAEVTLWSPEQTPGVEYIGPNRQPVSSARIIKSPEGYSPDELLAQYGSPEALGQALIDADPEVAPELVGREVGEVDRVWLSATGELMYSASVLEVITGADGAERSREDFIDVDANIGDDQLIPWSGRLLPIRDVVQRFALVRKLQVRHTNRLTSDFLFEIALHLQQREAMLQVGGGPDGSKPLILQRNGSPYRGFLEGRVRGSSFLLILHLSNLELKRVPH